MGFPGGSVLKESACRTGEAGYSDLIPGQEDPLEEMVTCLQYSCWEKLRLVCEVTKSRARLSEHSRSPVK